MKLAHTEAIVLHTLPVRERDKMVVFLTPDHGKLKGWAYGARAIRSRFGAALEPLAKVRIGYREKENEEAVRIESVDLIRSLFPAQQQLAASVAASYIAETIDTFAPENDPAELLYRLLDTASAALLDGASPLAVIAYAEVWALRLGGVFPSVRNCFDCGQSLSRPLRFDDVRQGFVCSSCATRDAAVVPNEVADALDTLFRFPVTRFAAEPPATATLMEIRSLAGSVRRYFLGHELKSFEVVASVVTG